MIAATTCRFHFSPSMPFLPLPFTLLFSDFADIDAD